MITHFFPTKKKNKNYSAFGERSKGEYRSKFVLCIAPVFLSRVKRKVRSQCRHWLIGRYACLGPSRRVTFELLCLALKKCVKGVTDPLRAQISMHAIGGEAFRPPWKLDENLNGPFLYSFLKISHFNVNNRPLFTLKVKRSSPFMKAKVISLVKTWEKILDSII